MIPEPDRRRRSPTVDRSSDRNVTLAAIAIAVGFLLAAVIVIVGVAVGRVDASLGTARASWLAVHLALAGGASTAIAGVMPFFVAALAAAPPTDTPLRASAVVLVATGAAVVVLGVVGSMLLLAAGGGVLFLAGIGLTAIVAIRPMRRGLGPSRGIVTMAYVAALLAVAAGAVLATIQLAGWAPVVDAWSRVRPAHAWLNLYGFASLVVAATLLHLLPTVLGTRIIARPSARVTVVGLAVGSWLVALGYATGSDPICRLGSLAVLGGALALGIHGWRTWSARGRWTTEHGWHRFAIGGLLSAIGWFVVGTVVATGRIVALGAAPSSWRLEAFAAPIVLGWIGLAILASASHLVPAIGPGDAAAHARQRAILGRAAPVRLIVIDLGVAIMWLGAESGIGFVQGVGPLMTGVGMGATAALLAAAVGIGTRAALARRRAT